jgi:hypothetical protein
MARQFPITGAITLAALVNSSCSTPEPKAALRVTLVETYWVLDPPVGGRTFLAPVVRFSVENISESTLLAVDATAAFRIDGNQDSWGSGYFRLTKGRKRLAPGGRVVVTMPSDARYALEGLVPPEQVFQNRAFKPVNVTFFLRVGSSVWTEFGRTPVENVLGSRNAREVLGI